MHLCASSLTIETSLSLFSMTLSLNCSNVMIRLIGALTLNFLLLAWFSAFDLLLTKSWTKSSKPLRRESDDTEKPSQWFQLQKCTFLFLIQIASKSSHLYMVKSGKIYVPYITWIFYTDKGAESTRNLRHTKHRMVKCDLSLDSTILPRQGGYFFGDNGQLGQDCLGFAKTLTFQFSSNVATRDLEDQSAVCFKLQSVWQNRKSPEIFFLLAPTIYTRILKITTVPIAGGKKINIQISILQSLKMRHATNPIFSVWVEKLAFILAIYMADRKDWIQQIYSVLTALML